eukprot:8112510-Pyramimonas_sp.AAC.1
MVRRFPWRHHGRNDHEHRAGMDRSSSEGRGGSARFLEMIPPRGSAFKESSIDVAINARAKSWESRFRLIRIRCVAQH